MVRIMIVGGPLPTRHWLEWIFSTNPQYSVELLNHRLVAQAMIAQAIEDGLPYPLVIVGEDVPRDFVHTVRASFSKAPCILVVPRPDEDDIDLPGVFMLPRPPIPDDFLLDQVTLVLSSALN